MEGDEASFTADRDTTFGWIEVTTAAGEKGLLSKGLVPVSLPAPNEGSDSIGKGKALKVS